jgi:uncharacterized protein GlcG (DUF336 family)
VKLTYPLASLLADIAVAKAESIGVPMVIAFSNENADLVYFGRMAGSLPASGEIAIHKAHTAAALRLTTQDIGRKAQPGGALYGIQHLQNGNIVLFGGGIPLSASDRIIGSVGISGGTPEEDISVAEAVQHELDRMVKLFHRLAPLLPDTVTSARRARLFGRYFVAAAEQIGGGGSSEWADVVAGSVLLAAGK